MWVKSIVTTSHNNRAVELRHLVSDDPGDPNDENWANGEPDEVEVEWRILQTEFNNPNGANNDLAGENEGLPNGDEVITRRYEFYKYAGPFDPETNEAKCDNYPQISDPGNPKYKPECDPATVTILGDYIGAQMAGFNVEAVLGLVDHVQDGDLDEPYTMRTVVVGGNTPYVTSVTLGSLPPGLDIDSRDRRLVGNPDRRRGVLVHGLRDRCRRRAGHQGVYNDHRRRGADRHRDQHAHRHRDLHRHGDRHRDAYRQPDAVGDADQLRHGHGDGLGNLQRDCLADRHRDGLADRVRDGDRAGVRRRLQR